MPTCLNIEGWRKATKKEALDFFNPDQKRPKGRRHLLMVRTYLRPADVYAYLKARFGIPNGFQNALRRDDSDNLIHWDFNLRADEVDIYLAGHSRSIQIIVEEPMTDDDWKALIVGIKADFARVGREKSKVIRSFEKFVLFQNKYVSLAGLCADLHADILDAPAVGKVSLTSSYANNPQEFKDAMDRVSKRANKIYGDTLKLRLLTPIMIEAFINMVILLYCKDSVRNNRDAYDAFLRARIPERLALLSQNCFGFACAVDTNTSAYANFMRIVSRRNFELHGNVDPMREQIEVVYFDGKRPLFMEPGNHIPKLFDHLEAIYRPMEAIREYEQAHEFMYEIHSCLEERYQEHFFQVVNDAFPGFEVHKRRPTRILPDQVVMTILPNQRYDDELSVQW